MNADTIFAVASGAGQAAIAVMRLSGPGSRAMLAALCGRVPPPQRASFRRLRGRDGAELDQGMVLWLPGPGSYTGEDSAELYLHGGRAVLTGVADALVALGARPAEPGEFTRRAFLNGRMDLTEAEAVHDLVAAETAAQRRQALRQLDGALGTLYGGWADRLRLLLAQQEALIDFPDEDLPPEVEAQVLGELASLQRELAAHLDDGRRGERLREGLVFAITGPPNVGQVLARERARGARRGHRLGNPWHDARRSGDTRRAGWRAGDAGGYRRVARSDRRNRGGRCPPGTGPRCGRRSGH